MSADVWTDKDVSGSYTETLRLEFADGSRLKAKFEIEAGERAFISAAGRFLNRLRQIVQEGRASARPGGMSR